MKIIGLSGGIASGKNFVAEIFKKNGAAIFDADQEVYKILTYHEASILQVAQHFPHSLINNKIDRKKLRQIVFADQKKLQILEAIIHPLVRKNYQKFLRLAQKKRKKIAILNIPLLLEKQGYKCDKIISLITSKITQKYRFLKRARKNNLDELEKNFIQIVARQFNNLERRKKSDFLINSAIGRPVVARQVKKILARINGA
jgi:dephospho-CoA kinase